MGLTVLLPLGRLYSYTNEFLHSSLEALHTPKRRDRPLLAKEGTIPRNLASNP